MRHGRIEDPIVGRSGRASMSGRFVALLAAASVWACGGEGTGPADAMVEGPALLASRIIATGPAGIRPADLYRSIDITLIGDSIALVDNGNDRIVLFDGELEMQWSSGRAGAGPGEFEAPIAVRASPGGLFAVDMGNGRFTELDRTGALLRTIKAPHSVNSFGVRADGGIVMPARLATHYAYLLTERDGAVPFARRDTLHAAADMFGNRARPPFLTVTADDTVHIFDETTFRLYKFDPEGGLRMQRALPAAFGDSVRARSEQLVESLMRRGYRVVGATMTATLQASGDGRLLLLLKAGLTAGLVIDRHTYEARRIVLPRDITEWAPLKTAGSAVLSGNRITVLSGDSLYVYELGPADS